MEAGAPHRVSSAWTGTSPHGRLGPPSLSHCLRRKGQGSGLRAAHFPGFSEEGTLLGTLSGAVR